MSSLLETVTGLLGSSRIREMSSQLGTDEATTGKAAAASLPLLLSGLAKNASQSSGAQALSSALDRDHDGSLLDNIGGLLGGALGGSKQSDGAGMLKHILGSRQPRVEAGIGKSTGMDSASVGKLLSMLAPVVMGALGRAKREKSMDSAALSNFLGGERKTLEKQAGREMGLLDQLLDADGDGDVDLGDIASRGSGLLGKLLGGR